MGLGKAKKGSMYFVNNRPLDEEMKKKSNSKVTNLSFAYILSLKCQLQGIVRLYSNLDRLFSLFYRVSNLWATISSQASRHLHDLPNIRAYITIAKTVIIVFWLKIGDSYLH